MNIILWTKKKIKYVCIVNQLLQMALNQRNREDSLENFNFQRIPESVEPRPTQTAFNASVEQNGHSGIYCNKTSVEYYLLPAVDGCKNSEQTMAVQAAATVSPYPTNTWSANPNQLKAPTSKENSCYQFESASNNFAQEPSASIDSFKNCQPQPFLFDERRDVYGANNRFGNELAATGNGQNPFEALSGNLQSTGGYTNWDQRLTSERFYSPMQTGNLFHSRSTVPNQFTHEPGAPSHFNHWQLQAPLTNQRQSGTHVKQEFGREMSQPATKINQNPLSANPYDLGLGGYSESLNRRMSSSAYNNHHQLRILPGDPASYIPGQTVNLVQVVSAGPKQFTQEPAAPTGYNKWISQTPFEKQLQTGIQEKNWLRQKVDQEMPTTSGSNRLPSPALSTNPGDLWSPGLYACQKWSVPTDMSASATGKNFDQKTGFKSPVTTDAWRDGTRKTGQQVDETQTSGEYSSILFQRYSANHPAGSQRLSKLDDDDMVNCYGRK